MLDEMNQDIVDPALHTDTVSRADDATLARNTRFGIGERLP